MRSRLTLVSKCPIRVLAFQSEWLQEESTHFTIFVVGWYIFMGMDLQVGSVGGLV